MNDGDHRRTREHVFPRACGGRITVPAGASCNNRIGHEIEGPFINGNHFALHNPDRLLRGTLHREDGRALRIERSLDGSREHVRPDVVETPDLIQINGTIDQVRRIALGMGHPPDAVEAVIEAAMAEASAREFDEITVPVVIDRKARLALASKVTLAALRTFGDHWVSTPQADQLRASINDPAAAIAGGRIIGSGAAAAVDQVISQALEPVGGEVAPISPGTGNQLVLIRHKDVVGAEVMLSNTPLGIGPLVDGFNRLDDDTALDDMATIITEGPEGQPRFTVRHLEQDVLRQLPRGQ